MLKFINTIKNKNKTSNQNKIKVIIHHLHEELKIEYLPIKDAFYPMPFDQIKGFFFKKKKNSVMILPLNNSFFRMKWKLSGLELACCFCMPNIFFTFVCLIAKLLRSGWRD